MESVNYFEVVVIADFDIIFQKEIYYRNMFANYNLLYARYPSFQKYSGIWKLGEFYNKFLIHS